MAHEEEGAKAPRALSSGVIAKAVHKYLWQIFELQEYKGSSQSEMRNIANGRMEIKYLKCQDHIADSFLSRHWRLKIILKV